MTKRKNNSKRRVHRKGLGNPMLAMSAVNAAQNMSPTTKKWIIGGSILAIAGLSFVGYKLYQNFFGTKVDETNTEMGENLRNLSVKKSDLTITADQAILIAQQIFDAMNQKGTDEITILNQLESLKTAADLLYVIKSFDIKNYGTWGESDSWIGKKLGYATPLNMSGWFKKELGQSSDSYKKIEAVYKKFNVPF